MTLVGFLFSLCILKMRQLRKETVLPMKMVNYGRDGNVFTSILELHDVASDCDTNKTQLSMEGVQSGMWEEFVVYSVCFLGVMI